MQIVKSFVSTPMCTQYTMCTSQLMYALLIYLLAAHLPFLTHYLLPKDLCDFSIIWLGTHSSVLAMIEFWFLSSEPWLNIERITISDSNVMSSIANWSPYLQIPQVSSEDKKTFDTPFSGTKTVYWWVFFLICILHMWSIPREYIVKSDNVIGHIDFPFTIQTEST